MKVFVKNINNEPLMPTTPRKARILLKEGKAIVVLRNPFTIKLLYPTGNAKQEIILGIDSGYLNIGFSAVTEKEEVLAGEIKLLNGMIERNKERMTYRRTRRNRLWHRRKGYNANTHREGWLAPSLQHKLDSHIRFIDNIVKILPITKVIVEIANFDIQKIKNPDIKGKQYQEGEQKGYSNVKAYVLHRDGYKCQNPNCKHKDKNSELHVHHIKYRSKGGSDSPSNLITLCTHCHTPENHNGFLLTWKPKTKGFKDATFMSTIRKMLVEKLRDKYSVEETYGYLTKEKRQLLGLEKTHYNDAFCVANGVMQLRYKPFEVVQVRRNNRSLATFYDAKYIDARDGSTKSGKELFNGRTTRNKNLNSENLSKYRLKKIKNGRVSVRKSRYPFQPMDLVKYNEQKMYVRGTQNLGKYVALKGSTKPVAVSKVEIVKYGKGFCWIDQGVAC